MCFATAAAVAGIAGAGLTAGGTIEGGRPRRTQPATRHRLPPTTRRPQTRTQVTPSRQVESNFLQPELAQRAAVWRAKGFPYRALALESMLDSLRTIEAAAVENNGLTKRRPN
jgi:hypothetical protein